MENIEKDRLFLEKGKPPSNFNRGGVFLRMEIIVLSGIAMVSFDIGA